MKMIYNSSNKNIKLKLSIYLPGSDFSFAFNLAETDATFQHARDPPVDGPVSFLHEMNLYKDLQEAIPGLWNKLLPSTNLSRYQGKEPLASANLSRYQGKEPLPSANLSMYQGKEPAVTLSQPLQVPR